MPVAAAYTKADPRPPSLLKGLCSPLLSLLSKGKWLWFTLHSKKPLQQFQTCEVTTMSTTSTASRAFDTALSSFKNGLTEKEKLDFSQTSIDDVYTETKRIQERQSQQGLLRNLRRIQPYINGLVQYSKVIEVFVQVKPEIMAFIWVFPQVKKMV